MAGTNTTTQETIATLLTDQVQPYDETDRRADSTRLMRLNDAKQMLRDAAQLINDRTPGVWQLLFANALETAGEALFAFTGAVKKLVRKAGFFEALIALVFEVDVALQPVARKFAEFFGQRTAEIVGGPWRKILAYFTPISTGQVKAEMVDKFFEALLARHLAELVDGSCVGIVQNYPRSVRIRIHERPSAFSPRGILLPQAKYQRRVRKTVRSRNPGNG